MYRKEGRKFKSRRAERKKKYVFSFHWNEHGAKMKGFPKRKK